QLILLLMSSRPKKNCRAPAANCPRTGGRSPQANPSSFPISVQRGRFSRLEAIDYYSFQPSRCAASQRRDEVTTSVRSGSGPDAPNALHKNSGPPPPPSRYLPVQRTQGNQPLVRAIQVPRDQAHGEAALRTVPTTPPLRPVAR